jgi:predicted ester cyclase
MNFEKSKQFIIIFCKNNPDFEYTIDDIIAEGDKVVVRATWRGTHSSEFMGVAPTGKKISESLIAIFRIGAKKIVEIWVIYDTFGRLRQLGAFPAPNK